FNTDVVGSTRTALPSYLTSPCDSRLRTRSAERFEWEHRRSAVPRQISAPRRHNDEHAFAGQASRPGCGPGIGDYGKDCSAQLPLVAEPERNKTSHLSGDALH